MVLIWLAQQAPQASATIVAWTGVVSGAIGGLSAVSGVLISQSAERRRANDNRVWNERAKAYSKLDVWAHDLVMHYSFYRLRYANPESPELGDTPPKRPSGLDDDMQSLLRLYGSDAVNRAYELARAAELAGERSLHKSPMLHFNKDDDSRSAEILRYLEVLTATLRAEAAGRVSLFARRQARLHDRKLETVMSAIAKRAP